MDSFLKPFWLVEMVNKVKLVPTTKEDNGFPLDFC